MGVNTKILLLLACFLAAYLVIPGSAGAQQPVTFGIGRPATPAEIAALDIDVRPDGAGLPPGHGTAAEGEKTYGARCAGCHGKTGKEGPSDVLVGREPRDPMVFARDPQARRTIGNYWPYATTLFDYVRRAMPTNAPGSLTADEIYGVVAYLLVLNEIIPRDAVMDATSLPKVMMPARDRFVPDPRGGPASVKAPARR
jgi:S-disulfanyl-L-cysteine oxidoreductase SoxD